MKTLAIMSLVLIILSAGFHEKSIPHNTFLGLAGLSIILFLSRAISSKKSKTRPRK